MDAAKSATAVFSKVFTDDPLASRVTPIKAVHFTELMDAINRVRSLTGLTAYAWSQGAPTPGGTVLRQHLLDLRTALAQAYQAAGKPTPTYAEPIVAGQTTIKASHLTELRNLVRALE